MTSPVPRPVAVGVDGSPAGLAAADWGAREAQLRDAPLRLVHAGEWQPYSHPPPEGPEAARRWSEGVPQEVTTWLHHRHPGLDITAERLTGPPPEVLCEAAQAAELLVIGTVGIGPVAGFLLGSVALATVAHSERPVVVVRARAADDGPHRGHPSGAASPWPVVLGLDLGRPCDDVIRFAFDAAALRVAPLIVVHGWNPPMFYAVGADPNEDADIAAEEQATLRRTLGPWREKYPTVDVAEQAVIGQPARHLLEAGSRAALVVVGRHTPSPRALPPRIGHIAHALLHHCPAPVAVVPH
ncbi:universal stress protein [Streptomyces bugieae]|uniref:Universal stress protein n=1 Tax=Streptomyces bugieae TaxID=3098223 RepID=A0ABU7NHD5_9ACTN|nr:universal stress protein [Streptomyces sp. DSM 41528]